MKTLEDFINELTPEEVEKHAALISECRSRQKEIEACSVDSRASIERFGDIILGITNNIELLKTEVDKLNQNIVDMKNLNLLKSIPDNDFFKE